MYSKRCASRDERGFAVFSGFLVLILLLTLGSASLVNSTLDLKSTTHYLTGNQAFFAAEGGVLHALGRMNQVGVINFKTDVVDRWSQTYGTPTKTVPGYSKVSYTVAVTADAGNPGDSGTITAVGSAPSQAQRVLQIGIRKGGFNGAPGAIYLAADSISSSFSGNAFEVDGNDHDVFGAPTGGDAKPGISTRNNTVTGNVVDSLSNGQKDNVQGLGFSLSPLTPSVLTTGGPSVDDLEQIVSHILSAPGVFTTSQKKFNGGDVFGTLASPQITYMTNPDVSLNGNASGAGILIADGSITINGTLDFVGWIIVRGETTINATGSVDDDTIVLGNATIYGSLWTGNLKIKVGGSAIIDYCDACMQLADTIPPSGNLVPQPMMVTSWQEVL